MLNKFIKVEVITNGSSNCIAINGTRICGAKMYGYCESKMTFPVGRVELQHIIDVANEAIKELDDEQADC